MADLNSGTKHCANCGQNINLASFMMHENFCIKNIVKCEICQKPYDKNKKDDHFEEYHAMIECHCGEKIERIHFDHHKTELCQKRPASCFFCELTLPFDKFEEHLNYCGSRTEKCDVCNRYVQLKDRYKHETSNCEYPPVPVKPTRVTRPIIHQSTANNNNGLPDRSGNRSVASATGSIAYLPCEFCDELFPNTTLMQHQDECESNPVAHLHYQLAHANLLNMFDHAGSTANQMLNDDDIEDLGALLREMESLNAQRTRAQNAIKQTNSTLALVDDGTDKKPCPYCKREIETRLLTIHENDCKERKNAMSPRRSVSKKSTNELNFDEVDANLKNLLKINNKPSSQTKSDKHNQISKYSTKPDLSNASRFDNLALDPQSSNRSDFSKKDSKLPAGAFPSITKNETKSFILPTQNAPISIGSLPIQSKPQVKTTVLGRQTITTTRPSGTRLRMQDPTNRNATSITTKPPTLIKPSNPLNASPNKPGANSNSVKTRSMTPAMNALGPVASTSNFSVKPLNSKPNK